MAAEQASEANTTPPKKGMPIKLVLLVIVLLAIAGSGVMVGKVMLGGKKKPAAKDVKPEIGAKVTLEEFLLNIGGGTEHYLKAQIAIGVKKDMTEKQVEEEFPPIRDTIISVLSSKGLKEFSSEEGRLKVKDELREKLNEELGKDTVLKVYFVSFAVQ